MPVQAADDDDRGALIVEPDLRQRLSLRDVQRGRLHRLPLAIEPVERAGDRGRLVLVGQREQPRAQRGVADAPAGVDARPHEIAEMVRAGRSVRPRDIEQRAQARPAARVHDGQALFDEGAVEAGQRRDVGDRGERDEIEGGEEIGHRPVGEKTACAKRALQGDKRHEDDASGAELAEPDRSSRRLGLTTIASGSSSGA